MKTNKQIPADHDNFKAGQGYGSAEKGADAQKNQSERQFGDNPLPPSGGDWENADELQPEEDPNAEELFADKADQTEKNNRLKH